MNYIPRPGIVSARLCGMTILIPSRMASEHCTVIVPLTFLGTVIWTGIEKDYPVEKILEMMHIFSKKPDEELTERIDGFCQNLLEKGFVVPKNDLSAEESSS